jgi:peptidoglycan hydrolase-like protein with peptidoglycan-binding domain
MKPSVRALLLACTSVSLVFANAAQAKPELTPRQIRTAQVELADLGYEVGMKDGVAGPMTINALIDFQRHSQLPITGALDVQTAQLLQQVDVKARGDFYAANGVIAPRSNENYDPYHATAQITTITPMAYDSVRSINVQPVPVRFGNLAINEDHRGPLSNYSITLNGQPVLLANNQPAALRVSKIYSMSGEDAVILTAHDGTGGCMFKNYLLSIHSDGTASAPREIGNCSGTYQARLDGNALFVSFSDAHYTSDSSRADNWRYGDDRLARI